MLVLSRHVGERICIGSNIFITINRIDHDKVRVGIEAPRDVRIDREEVSLRIARETERTNPRAPDKAA